MSILKQVTYLFLIVCVLFAWDLVLSVCFFLLLFYYTFFFMDFEFLLSNEMFILNRVYVVCEPWKIVALAAAQPPLSFFGLSLTEWVHKLVCARR